MPLTTVTVSISAASITGGPFPNGHITFALTVPEVDGGLVVQTPVTVALDANGAATAALWPNALGTQASQYTVFVTDKYGTLQWNGLATIPNSNCNLQDVLNLTPPPALSDALAAQRAAQSYAAQAFAAAALVGLPVTNGVAIIDCGGA